MLRWTQAPWTLRAFVVIQLAVTVVVAIVASSTPVVALLFSVAFVAVVCFFLLCGVRWLWLLSLAFVFLGFPIGAIEGNLSWYGIALGIVALVLLLHPTTRRYFTKPEGEVSH